MATFFFKVLAHAPPWAVRLLRNGPFAQARIYRLTRGRVAGTFSGVPVLLLTTVGRKSGKTFTTPVMYLADDGRYLVVAGGTGQKLPSWYLNARGTPDAVVIQVRGERMAVHAETVPAEERQTLWSKLTALWPGYEAHQQTADFEFPVVRLTPAG